MATLIVNLGPYRFSTRSRKAANVFASTMETTFLSLERVGRSGRADAHGRWLLRNGELNVRQLKVWPIRTEPSIASQVWNAGVVYSSAWVRLLLTAVRIKADQVYVTNLSMASMGVVYKILRGANLCVDINERPGFGTTKGSVASISAKFDPLTLRIVRRFADTVMVATPADKEYLESTLGFRNVHVVLNAPELDQRSEYVDPPLESSFKLVCVGSIFEGRAYEQMIDAVGILTSRGDSVQLEIVGGGREAYVESLKARVAELNLESSVLFRGPISPDQVSDAYLSADAGLVLYEPTGPANDGLSNKLMECVSSGRPVIAGNLPQNREFVSGNNVGWVTSVDASSLAETIATAMGSKDLKELSRHCRSLGDTVLNWESQFEPVASSVQRPAS